MSKICCFTGHRTLSAKDSAEIDHKLKQTLVHLIEDEDVTDFRAGGAIGFDSIAALTVLELKQRYPEIKLHLILPCKDQDLHYSEQAKKIYKITLQAADTVTYVQERYTPNVMHLRNRALVDGSDICIAFMKHLSGGTYYTVNYARKCGVKVVNLGSYT